MKRSSSTAVFLITIILLTSGCGIVPTHPVPPTLDIGQVIAETSASEMTRIAERIVPYATDTPEPLLEIVPTEVLTPTVVNVTAEAANLKDIALLLGTLSMAPGSRVYPGEEFQVTWRIRNIGETIWDDTYSLVYGGGEAYGQELVIPLSIKAAPGDIIDLTLPLTAPAVTGNYRGEWWLVSPAGIPFGVGYEDPKPLVVDVVVGYNSVDFGEHEVLQLFNGYSTAEWRDQYGTAFCSAPGNIGAHGSVTRQETVVFEGVIEDNDPTLVMQPAQGDGGFIEGVFPPFHVGSLNYFSTRIGCMDDNTHCDVKIQILIQIVGETAVDVFWEGTKTFTGEWVTIHQPLEKYKGQDIKFIFRVENNGDATDDIIGFFAPVILH